ncbi:MAG: lytic transglycosylase domain-containing protein [Firmicutes bacterium]|nr:lytic transglycosylase domain-containing protein [Bacillota bacterium]
MGTSRPLPGTRPVKKVKSRKEKGNLPLKIFRIVCSPLLLFVDIFRARPSPRVFKAFLWLMLALILLMTGLFFWVDRQETRLQEVLGSYFSYAAGAIPVSTEIQEIIHRNALLFNVSPQLVTAVIQAESSFDPEAYSPKGACGLMQLTPLVWQAYNPDSKCNGRHRPGEKNHGRDCIYNIEANIATGVRYLKDLIDYFDGETGRALEAYNAGLTNVDLEKIRPKYRETRAYLGRIGQLLARDELRSFVNLYDLNRYGRTILRGLFLVALFLWAVFLFWVKKHYT